MTAVAELALRTHRCRRVPDMAVAAATAGVRWIDTAPDDQDGTAEGRLGRALRDHPQVRVSTKVGYIGRHAADAVRAGVLTDAEARVGHSLKPRYIAWQTARSNWLLRRRPELVFAANPEHGEPGPAALETTLLHAFEALEEGCANHMFSSYGVATWSCLHTGTLSIERIVELAVKAAGGSDHHLRAVQLPLSLARIGPLLDAHHGRGVLVDAENAGLEVFASAPLAGGELIQDMTPAAARRILGGSTPLQLLLGAVANTAGVSHIALSASTARHWNSAANSLTAPLSPAAMRRTLHAFAPDRKTSGRRHTGQGTGSWARRDSGTDHVLIRPDATTPPGRPPL